jgi:AmpE protein
MKLVIILLCLSLERYLNLGAVLLRYTWFSAYRGLMDKLYRPQGWMGDWLQYGIVLVPLLLVLGLFWWIMVLSLAKLGAFLVSALALLYALGPVDLYHQMQKYTNAQLTNDTQTALEIESKLGVHQGATLHRDLTIAAFTAANERLFAVLFWFLILGPLGPVGAIGYRVTALLAAESQPAAQIMLNILNWLPVRIEGLLYSLVGNFSAGFGCLLRRLIGGLESSGELLTECSLLALEVNNDPTQAASDEYNQALAVIDRAVIVSIVLITVFTLGMWLA